MDVAREFLFVERPERRGLQARPFDAEAVGVHAQARKPFDVFGIAMIVVTRHAAIPAVRRDIIRPFIFDMAFNLGWRRRGAPEESVREFQKLFLYHCTGVVSGWPIATAGGLADNVCCRRTIRCDS